MSKRYRREAAKARTRDTNAMSGKFVTEPLIARCPCGGACALRHHKKTRISYLHCVDCGASNLDQRAGAIA